MKRRRTLDLEDELMFEVNCGRRWIHWPWTRYCLSHRRRTTLVGSSKSLGHRYTNRGSRVEVGLEVVGSRKSLVQMAVKGLRSTSLQAVTIYSLRLGKLFSNESAGDLI